MQILIRLLIPAAFLAIGWIGYLQFSIEPEKQQRPPPEPRVIHTEVIELRLQDFQTAIPTQGVVRPTNEATLTSQISGKIQTISEKLSDGAFFSKGDILVTLDIEDFQASVIAASADLARANAALSQEEARGKQARRNWEDLGYKDEPNDLVLRIPQLLEAQTNVEAATASLERAERDLARTEIKAHFDGRVLQRTVSVGQSISSSTALAIAFMTDYVDVRLPVAAKDLAFLNLPESSAQKPVDITLRDALNSESEAEWPAQIIGTEGSLDPSSRELFAIARVIDPFSRKAAPGKEKPPLRIGQPVRTEIAGITLKRVYVIPREAVRRLDQIYLVTDEMTLERREDIEPIWSDETRLIIRDSTIPEGSLLATSRLVYAPDAAKVEIIEPEPEATIPNPAAASTAPGAGANAPSA